MLDIRYPIGLMFAVIGPVLVVFGLVTQFSDPGLYQRHSMGVNVNLWWGLVLSVFGLFMLRMAWRARRAGDAAGSAASSEETPGQN